MKLALAQIIDRGSLTENMLSHVRILKKCFEEKVDLVVFPEMSLTGYFREDAALRAMAPQDKRLDNIREMLMGRDLTAVVGAPIKIDGEVHIGSFILSGNVEKIYTKQFVHDTEGDFFVGNDKFDPILTIQGMRVMLSICYDMENDKHFDRMKDHDIDLYLASIFYTEGEMDHAAQRMSKMSSEHGVMTAFANYSGLAWNLQSGGHSGLWDKNGQSAGQLEKEEGLILFDLQFDVVKECTILT